MFRLLSMLTLMIAVAKNTTGYQLSLKQELHYAKKGSIKLPNVFPSSTIKYLKSSCLIHIKENELSAYQQKLSAILDVPMSSVTSKYPTLKSCKSAINSHVTSIPFLQYFNLHLTHSSIKTLTSSPLLPTLASKLMSSKTLRLYQTSLFYKRKNDASTLWHSDLKMSPFDTNKFVTFWIPLTEISKESTLEFVDESHLDFALPFWNNANVDLSTRQGYDNIQQYALKLGDLTAHNGWTLHSAPPNFDSKDRLALTVSYVDGEARVREGFGDKVNDRGDGEDEMSYGRWIDTVKEGKRIPSNHKDMPLIKC
ncbi:hypothetical protein TL16_g03626 [Triparma laevis f. inornata]|uniref:Phytanoyl-CoA dioxygenase n=2 Tax=Triparma laevis TaxID=1534972 RepID=A0A9W6ZRQ1_9STRA|nr:hypothetical protein TrLO_g11286 [Triparma laevis f. longispina]GMH63094.1 hypothetical protein TL16_g03626 [Triparma laevis f. inornata]